MEKLQVVPDVIDKAPHTKLEIIYRDNAIAKEGNELTPTKVKDQPIVKWESEKGGIYLLCMIDPDAPSRKNPKFREWHHWLVGNIPGNDIKKGDVLSEYIGAGPTKDTGLHRYVFLVYKQPGKIKFKETKLSNKSGNGRASFSIKKFAKKYNLGEPIAGNFFQAKWDSYVPTLHKRIGG